MARDRAGLQVRVEEVFDPMPGVTQHVLAREVMEFAGIRHERDKVALPLLQQLVNEADGVEVRDVHIGRAMQHEERTGEADPDWPDLYALYMVRERAGEELPT